MRDPVLPLHRIRRQRELFLPPVSARIVRTFIVSLLFIILLTLLAAYSSRHCFLSSSGCCPWPKSPTSWSAPTSIRAVPSASWSFLHGQEGERDAVLHVQNLCSSPKHGVFYVDSPELASKSIPSVNVIASAPELDKLWSPTKLSKNQLSSSCFRYLSNTTLFVMGTIWNHHMSHYYVNNGMPLLDVMRSYFKDWSFGGEWMQTKRHLAVTAGGDKFFEAIDIFKFEEMYSAHSEDRAEDDVASTAITCYANAVIGLNSTCAHNFCKNQHADKHIYKFLHKLVWQQYLTAAEATKAMAIQQGQVKQKQHAVIVQRKHNRHMVNIDAMAASFTKHGISNEIVHLENMSYRDQVRLFALKATVIVGVHGNAIAHFLWSQRGTLVIEVFQMNWHSDWQELILKQMAEAEPQHATDIRYAKIECNDQSCSENMSGLNANVKVNITALDSIIESHLQN